MESTKSEGVRELKRAVRDRKRVLRTERHVRWNWEVSSAGPGVDGSKMIRIHLVVADDRNREQVMGRIVSQIISHPFTQSIEPVRSISGSVRDSRNRYLLQSYDTYMSPKVIDWSKVRKPIIADENLKERVKSGYSIEQYVEKLYNAD